MRNPMVSVTILTILFFSATLQAGQWLNIVASGHGSTCDEAKNNLRDVVLNGSDAYTADQGLTHQFPTATSALAFCQASAAPAPHLVTPEVQDEQMFALPTEKYDVSVNATCSWVADENGNRTYGVGWTGSGACYEDIP